MPRSRQDPHRRDRRDGFEPLDPRAMVARYDQLIAFQEGVLRRMRGLRQDLSPSARALVDERDIRPLRGLITRFRRRRSYWRRRLADEEANDGRR